MNPLIAYVLFLVCIAIFLGTASISADNKISERDSICEALGWEESVGYNSCIKKVYEQDNYTYSYVYSGNIDFDKYLNAHSEVSE